MTEGALFCSVKVEGQELVDLVVRLRVEESDSRADNASILFADSNLVLCDVLHEGQTIEIDLGRTDEHAVVFRGVATSVSMHVPLVGSPVVELLAQDGLIRLSLVPKTKRWGNTTVSSIVRTIATDNNLVPGTISPGDDAMLDDHRPAQQVAETDLAFLQRLAQTYDSKLYVDHTQAVDSLNFVSNQSLLEADPIEQSLVFNSTLVDFRASFDSWAADPEEQVVTTEPDRGSRVAVIEHLFQSDDVTWTPDATRIARLGAGTERITTLIASSAGVRAQLRTFQRTPSRLAGAPARQSSDHARIHGDGLRRRGQTGRGRASGSIWLRPRARVQIVGYGGRWSGVWYLSRVRHEVDLVNRNYVTAFVSVR